MRGRSSAEAPDCVGSHTPRAKSSFLFEFWMVFIGNPRSGTNMGGGNCEWSRIRFQASEPRRRLLHSVVHSFSFSPSPLAFATPPFFSCNKTTRKSDRSTVRSKPNYLRLLHTWSIMSTKNEVEMVVLQVVGHVAIPMLNRDG